MLPPALFAGHLEACIVVLGKNLRDHGEQGKALYFAFLCSRSVIFKRKGIPGGVATHDSETLIYGIDHARIAVVVRWPTQDHYHPHFSRGSVSFAGNRKAMEREKRPGRPYERSVPGARRM